MKNGISVIIVNYNGRHLLEECLPAILDACISSDLIYETIVVDNASTDDSIDFLKKKYPSVVILPMKTNNYWFSVNDAVKKSSHDPVLLLNNDVKLDRSCVDHLFKRFSADNDKIFAVVPKEIRWDGITLSKGAQYLEVINESFLPSLRSFYFDKPHITFNAGNAIYAKDKLIELGLFDPLFLPFYYEDVDLSYRAWKAGFEIIYEPTAIIYHNSGTSVYKYTTSSSQTKYGFKNSLLFVWKNITDTRLFLRHIIFLTARIIKGLLFFRGRKEIIIGLILAIKSLRQVLAVRREAMKNLVLTDKEVLRKLDVRNFYEKT